MSSERTSVIKKKGGGGSGEFQNMYLAVFPYEVEFLKNVDHRTSFYFEKSNPIIMKSIKLSDPFHDLFLLLAKAKKYPQRLWKTSFTFDYGRKQMCFISGVLISFTRMVKKSLRIVALLTSKK